MARHGERLPPDPRSLLTSRRCPPTMTSRDRYRHGIPIEEAPSWVLAIVVGLLWLIAFPALVGLLAARGAWHGQRLATAAAALGVALLIVVAVATRKPWRRPRGPSLHDSRPVLVRFSTWLITAVLLPNVIFGTIVLAHPDDEISYESALVLGLLVSAIHGAFALADRVKAWWRGRGSAGEA